MIIAILFLILLLWSNLGEKLLNKTPLARIPSKLIGGGSLADNVYFFIILCLCFAILVNIFLEVLQ